MNFCGKLVWRRVKWNGNRKTDTSYVKFEMQLKVQIISYDVLNARFIFFIPRTASLPIQIFTYTRNKHTLSEWLRIKILIKNFISSENDRRQIRKKYTGFLVFLRFFYTPTSNIGTMVLFQKLSVALGTSIIGAQVSFSNGTTDQTDKNR